jgi:ATP-dependent DNA helicase RecG
VREALVIPLEELRLKVEDLKQALDYEKRHRYVDVQGRKKVFSSYVNETLKLLKGYILMGEGPAEGPVESFDQLIARFKQYRYMDISARMHAMEQMESFLADFNPLGPPGGENRRRTATTTAARTSEQHAGKSVHEIEIQYLKGVGPKYAQLLNQVGVKTVENLLYYFPRRYLDYNNRMKIKDLADGQEVTVWNGGTPGDDTIYGEAGWLYGGNLFSDMRQAA